LQQQLFLTLQTTLYTLQEYKDAFPESTLCHIMHQKFVRRVDGKTAARAVFAASLPLRKSGVLGFEVYLAHAAIELHVNKEPEVVSLLQLVEHYR
jgi:Suppressor of forked protein (Suf)